MSQERERIAAELERWKQTTLKATLDRQPERYPEFITASGEPVERLYTPLDVEGDYPVSYTHLTLPTIYSV